MNKKAIMTGAVAFAVIGSMTAQAALVGEWTFDAQSLANTGTSGSTHDGTFESTITPAATYVANGSGGYALQITSISNDDSTGGGDVLTINNSNSGDAGYVSTFDGTAFTVSMWVSSTDSSWQNWDALAEKGREKDAGWEMRARLTSGHGFYSSLYDGTSASQVKGDVYDLVDGDFHLLTTTYDQTAGTLVSYFDGVAVGSTTTAAALASGAAYDLGFGARSDGSRGENILMDSIQYYDTALNASEVAALAIPEPATLGLVAAFGGGLLFVRRLMQI